MTPAASLHDLRPVAMGVLHSPFACAFCGETTGLRPSVLVLTRVEAGVCVDLVECIRRQLRQREAA
jgi:hypothetical protein